MTRSRTWVWATRSGPAGVALLVAAALASLVNACSSGESAPPAEAGSPDSSGSRDATGDREAAATDAGSDVTRPPGEPVLVELAVTSSAPADASTPFVLTPAFTPAIRDYYVPCVAGPNVLAVSLKASAGSDSLLVQPQASPSLPAQKLTVTVYENDAIVAVATNGKASTEYWVRCLPHDFPPFRWVDHADAGAREAGYYLLGNLGAPPGGAFAMVFDGNGVPVWYLRTPTADGVFDVESLAKNAVSFTPWTFVPSPYEIHRLDLGTTAYVVAPFQDEHELQLLPNGDALLIANPLVSGVDLSGLGVTQADGGVVPLGPNRYILDCKVVEVSPTGAIVWSWTATQHFVPKQDCTWPQPAITSQTAPDGGVVIDAFHCNSIDVDPNNGNLLVSSRAMDSIFYVERSTGNVLWKMGGSAYTKEGATYVPVDSPFHRQHDARLQPDWTPTCAGGHGSVSLFDDETFLPGPARAAVYRVQVGPGDGGGPGDCGAAPDAAGAPTGATLAWHFDGKVSSASMGSFRILADGSRVVGWGLGGTKDLALTEVNLGRADLLDLFLVGSQGSYRAIKVPPSAFDIEVLRRTSGRP